MAKNGKSAYRSLGGGVTLPWRETAVHLGHTLHQDLTFNTDATVRRAIFINRSVEVRSQFAFAAPAQILTAVRILCCDGYGSVLWRLSSPTATSFFKAYSSCVRRIYRLPVNTFTYLVEGHFSQGLAPLRNMVLGRYPAFFPRMAWSSCSEVSLMAGLAAQDARTITASNLALISALTKLDCATAGGQEVKHALPVQEVQEKEGWRLGLLDALLQEQYQFLVEIGFPSGNF